MTYKTILTAVTMFILSAVVNGQTQEKRPNPNYDAALAAILKTGPSDATIKGEERTRLFQGHMANIRRLADAGQLAIAGPFGKNDKSFRGLFILNASTVDEAQRLAESDPAIKAGIFVVDYIPWYGSASVLATSDIHKKITKTID
jgi:uncharacterized protein